ncbi:MAG: hypothetical protein JXA77_10250 [Bacteroidales bacterium]|nr:hypothetical protein [Bacteroidales bacterium]MBN2818271.1 hypothetical protein [Bacteroidales bacterium]
MSDVLCKFKDGSYVKFGKGRFDNWCVFLYTNSKGLYAPKDVEYFEYFARESKILSADKVYGHFVGIYNKTDRTISEEVIKFIHNISSSYSNSLIAAQWFVVIYAGMVAEENKKNAILKKRIKRLGMHQVIIENLSPSIAAAFSKGKKWNELDLECKKRNF